MPLLTLLRPSQRESPASLGFQFNLRCQQTFSITFLEAGSNSTYDFTLFNTSEGTLTSDTTADPAGNLRSIKCGPASTRNDVQTASGSIADTGTRISFWFKFDTTQSVTKGLLTLNLANGSSGSYFVQITNGNKLVITDSNNVVLGTSSTTLVANTWYRICLAYVISSTTVNHAKLYINSLLEIDKLNATLVQTASALIHLGQTGINTLGTFWLSGIYIDNSADLQDAGNVMLTAKRPNANNVNTFGAAVGNNPANRYTNVNERPSSQSNGWESTAGGQTENYGIESAAGGDLDSTTGQQRGYRAWISAEAVGSIPTVAMTANGSDTTITLTTSVQVFSVYSVTTTYPTNVAAIGLKHVSGLDNAVITEAGFIIAFQPALNSAANALLLQNVLSSNPSIDFAPSSPLALNLQLNLLTGSQLIAESTTYLTIESGLTAQSQLILNSPTILNLESSLLTQASITAVSQLALTQQVNLLSNSSIFLGSTCALTSEINLLASGKIIAESPVVLPFIINNTFNAVFIANSQTILTLESSLTNNTEIVAAGKNNLTLETGLNSAGVSILESPTALTLKFGTQFSSQIIRNSPVNTTIDTAILADGIVLQSVSLGLPIVISLLTQSEIVSEGFVNFNLNLNLTSNAVITAINQTVSSIQTGLSLNSAITANSQTIFTINSFFALTGEAIEESQVVLPFSINLLSKGQLLANTSASFTTQINLLSQSQLILESPAKLTSEINLLVIAETIEVANQTQFDLTTAIVLDGKATLVGNVRPSIDLGLTADGNINGLVQGSAKLLAESALGAIGSLTIGSSTKLPINSAVSLNGQKALNSSTACSIDSSVIVQAETILNSPLRLSLDTRLALSSESVLTGKLSLPTESTLSVNNTVEYKGKLNVGFEVNCLSDSTRIRSSPTQVSVDVNLTALPSIFRSAPAKLSIDSILNASGHGILNSHTALDVETIALIRGGFQLTGVISLGSSFALRSFAAPIITPHVVTSYIVKSSKASGNIVRHTKVVSYINPKVKTESEIT